MKAARSRFPHPIVIAGILFAILPFILPRIGSTASLATEIAIYALYALGFNLLLGYTGLVSFGASAFFGAGSYVAGLAVLHLFHNMYLSILFGAVISGLLVGISVALSIQFWPAASSAVMYALMIVVLLVRPRGLLGESWERFE